MILLDYIKLAGGTVYDPSNGVDGQRKDIWVAAGQVVEAPETTSADSVRTIDADGMVVMPGGVDMHCHIAGPKVNAGRKMQPEQYAGQEVEKREMPRFRQWRRDMFITNSTTSQTSILVSTR